MFKGFQNTSRTNGFNGFPALNFQMNNEAYGFSGCTFWLDAAYGLNTQTDLAAVSSWQTRIGGVIFVQNTAANQPIFNLSDISFNNLPTVNANTTNKFMTNNSAISIDNNKTFAWISKPDANGLTDTILGSNTAYTILLDSGADNASITGPGVYSSSGSFTGITENTSPKISIWTYSTVVVNGTVEKTGTYTGRNDSFYNLFRYNTGTSLYNYNGRLAELIIYNYKMNSDQMTQLSSRLNSKYAIY